MMLPLATVPEHSFQIIGASPQARRPNSRRGWKALLVPSHLRPRKRDPCSTRRSRKVDQARSMVPYKTWSPIDQIASRCQVDRRHERSPDQVRTWTAAGDPLRDRAGFLKERTQPAHR